MKNNSHPFFSIITCTKDSEKYIKKNILSVNDQSFNDYEHIFIDGNSADKTLFLIKNYKKLNSNKVRIFNLRPTGMVKAMNYGIKKARGLYIIHLNSDDYFNNSRSLELIHKCLSSKKLDWIFGKTQIVNASGQKIGTAFPQRWLSKFFSFTLLKYLNFIPHQSTFIKKDVFVKYGYFDENLTYSNEYEYWLRIFRQTSWFFMDKTISNFRVWRESATFNPKNKMINQEIKFGIQKKYLTDGEVTIAGFLNTLFRVYRTLKIRFLQS